jgi:hypothetical protein
MLLQSWIRAHLRFHRDVLPAPPVRDTECYVLGTLRASMRNIRIPVLIAKLLRSYGGH